MDPSMAARPTRTEAQIGDVHDDDVEDAPAGRGFKVGLCRYRPILVPTRQVDPCSLGT